MPRSPVLAMATVLAAVLGAVFVVGLIAVASDDGDSAGDSADTGMTTAPPSFPTPPPSLPFAPDATGVPSFDGTPTTIPNDGQATPRNFRVAFVGDQGIGKPARDVLGLVKSEGAQMLLILGDFDYDDNPNAWDAMLTQALGATFPIFAVVGNHDEKKWPEYRTKLTNRLANIEGARCTGDYGVNAACTYRNLFFVLSGVGTEGRDHAAFLRESLAANDAIWSVCAWHKNQTALQLGEKSDEVGWDAYEQCRQGGAIIATAHEHSYSRTKTLSNMQSQTIDSAWPSATELRVAPGSSFVFVSGLGGASERKQARCKPSTPPYGCGGIWGSVYTTDQDADPGVLFIDFNVDGDPRKARGYFKNIKGRVVDTFTVVSQMP